LKKPGKEVPMRPIDQAFEEIRALHEQVTRTPAPEVTPRMFQPFPPGTDPVSYAIEEVAELRRALEQTAEKAEKPQATSWVPRASVYAGESGAKFVVELPGISRDDVVVTVNGGQLIVRGERKPASIDGSLQPMVVEQSIGAFERRFALPGWCQVDTISARCANGVLEIDIARQPEDGTDYKVQVG
jgi:HSP20 family protein